MQNNEPARYNFNGCNRADADAFVAAMRADNRFALKSEFPVTDKCHFERYNFTCEGGKIVVVYDTKAAILSLTARPEVLEELKKLFLRPVPILPHPAAPANNAAAPPAKKQAGIVPSAAGKPNAETKAASVPKPPVAKSSAPKQSAVKQSAPKQPSPKTSAKIAAPQENPAKPDAVAVGESLPEYKNGFSIKKCSSERLEGILKRVKALDGVTAKIGQTTFGGTPQETVTYEVSDRNKQKLKLRYMPKKQSLQLQGKRSNLFGEVQVILSRDSEYLAAVNSHIELTGEEKRAGEIQRTLKKVLPDAFAFLSDQSKIDLSIGMIDIGNDEVRLSDYSVLLVPPYRGLERLIYDLQTAQGISVKMIGQAYEKDDEGHYLLKAGYRKKIQSVVYNEVMSALYTEYFEKRNFYAHADNSSDSLVRRIEDKQTARAIFNRLCAIINYNCKKLKEIGFAVHDGNH